MSAIAVRDAGLKDLPWPIHLLGILIAIAGAALVSLHLGQDANWDLQSYHFYNPYAFVNDRMHWDIAPAQLQSYYNPLLDLPFYWAVQADWPPQWIAVLLALPAGIAAYLLWRILRLLFGEIEIANRRDYIALTLIIGLTGSAGAPLIGSTMNEWPDAMLILLALWLVLVPPDASLASAWRNVVAAGVTCGIAAGLKLTAATYALGMCLALLVQRPLSRRGLPAAASFGLAVISGLLLTSGFWMWRLYADFQNPVFPYFNNWVHSPWWSSIRSIGSTVRIPVSNGWSFRFGSCSGLPGWFRKNRSGIGAFQRFI